MTLDRLLRVALPVVASFYACGSEAPAPALGGVASQPCHSDLDCKGERVCVDGYCKNPAGSVEGPCGNSPLTGKYLWNVGNCHIGSETPFSTSCRGELATYENADDQMPIGGEITITNYSGLVLSLSYPDSTTGTMELSNSFSLSDVTTSLPCNYEGSPTPADQYNLVQCLFSERNDLYVGKQDGLFCLLPPNLFLITTAPFTRSSCQNFADSLEADFSECE